MESEQKLVLSKIKATKQERADVAPGAHKGSFLMRCDYGMNVGEDYTQRIVGKATPWKLVTVLFSYLNGVSLDSITRKAIDVDPSLVDALKERAHESAAKIKAETWTDCKGKVTFDYLDLTPVDEVEIGHLVDALSVLTRDELAREEA